MNGSIRTGNGVQKSRPRSGAEPKHSSGCQVMPRLFTGIKIPQDVKSHISLLYGGLPGARWIEIDNLHITLRFIGDVDDQTGRVVAEALHQVQEQPFNIKLSGVGCFGGRKPRAVWVDMDKSPELMNLQLAHENQIRATGLPHEGRNFKPHITLTRLRGHTKSMDVARYLDLNSGFAARSFEVRSFELFSSRPGKGGGPYVVEQTYPLTTNSGL